MDYLNTETISPGLMTRIPRLRPSTALVLAIVSLLIPQMFVPALK